MDRAIHSREEYEERAEIIEYDGGLDRNSAEILAKELCYGKKAGNFKEFSDKKRSSS